MIAIRGKNCSKCSSLWYGVSTGCHKQLPKVLSVVPFTVPTVKMCLSEVSDEGEAATMIHFLPAVKLHRLLEDIRNSKSDATPGGNEDKLCKLYRSKDYSPV